MISYNQFVGLLNQMANAHEQLRTFGEGDLWEIGASADVAYPLMWAMPQPSVTDHKVFKLKMSLVFADLVNKDISNQQDVANDTLQIALDILTQLTSPAYDDDFVLDEKATLTPFNDKFDDEVTGWKADIVININYLSDRCAVPSLLSPTEIIAGCAPVIIVNSDGSYSVTFPSGSTYLIPDSEIIDSDGMEVSLPATASYICKNIEQLIEAIDAATLYNDLTSASKLNDIIALLSDSDLTNLSSVQLTFIVSLLTTELLSLNSEQLEYILANDMSAVFLNNYMSQGFRNKINQISCNKTGQTTSYGTGDDGDVEKGKSTNFLTLSLNNIFGNTLRFTDDQGGQIFGSGNGSTPYYMIDHATGYGWAMTYTPITSWANGLTVANALTLGAYSGFRMPNVNEGQTLVNWSGTNFVANGFILQYSDSCIVPLSTSYNSTIAYVLWIDSSQNVFDKNSGGLTKSYASFLLISVRNHF